MGVIAISKNLVWDDEKGRFSLSDKAQEIIYREKQVICSYSGSCEWANHFFCELVDLYCGSSPFNYTLCTCQHEKDIPRLWKESPNKVNKWIEDMLEEEWFQMAATAFDFAFDNLPYY